MRGPIFAKAHVLVVIGLLLAGCALTPDAPEPEVAAPVVRGRDVVARGFGRAKRGTRNIAQRRSGSRDAAILAAQGRMLVKIKRLRLRRKRRSTVGRRMRRSRKLRRRIDAVLRGAEIFRSTWKSDGASCTVEIRIPVKRLEAAVGFRLK